GEGQYRDRRLFGKRRIGAGLRHRRLRGRDRAVGSDRPRDVLERLLADVFEGEIQPARGVLLDPRRNTDPARFGQSFEAGRDINAVAKDVAILDDNVADIDADAEVDAAIGRRAGVAPGHLALHLDSAAQCIHDAAKLDERAVTGSFYEAALVLG